MPDFQNCFSKKNTNKHQVRFLYKISYSRNIIPIETVHLVSWTIPNSDI